MSINNLIYIIIIIITITIFKNNELFQGPCLQHCYNKYSLILLIGIFLFGYYVCKNKLIDL